MRSVIRPRGPASPPAGRRSRATPGDHPFVLGAGVAGLLAASIIRRRSREPRDEPRVLGLGF